MMSTPAPAPSIHADRDLDLSSAGRGVWLVKVPKYISSRWQKAPGDLEVGRLRISKAPGQKPLVNFQCSEAIMCLQEKGEEAIPKEHKFLVNHMASQTLGVFSRSASNPEAVVPEPEKLVFEGKVVQKVECRTLGDLSYMNLKRDIIKKASQPQRHVMQLTRPVQTYKPVSNHLHNIEYEERKKAEGKKSRDDKDKVQEMLFAAFEKHQYYNIKDLVKITNQPITYLKEILKEVCSYNLKNPHKNMWELKPEYRHYKEKIEQE